MANPFTDRRSPDYVHLPRRNDILAGIMKTGFGFLENLFRRRQFENELLDAICKDDQVFRDHSRPVVQKFSEILNELMPETLMAIVDYIYEEVGQEVAVEMVAGVQRSEQHGDVSFCCNVVNDKDTVTSQVKCFYAFDVNNSPENTDHVLQYLTEYHQKGSRYDLLPRSEVGKELYDKYLGLIRAIDPDARVFVTQFSRAPVAALVALKKLSTPFGFVIRTIAVELDPNEIELVSKVPVEPPRKLF